MKKCRYPSSCNKDFSLQLLQETRAILSLPLSTVYETLCRFLHEGRRSNLLCILRVVFESPVNCENVSIIGWFIINDLIPAPSAFVYFQRILFSYSSYDDIIVSFVRAILTKLPRFCSICKYVLSNEKIKYLQNELYILISQIENEPIQFEECDHRSHFVIPKKRGSFNEITNVSKPPSLASNVNMIPLKSTIFQSIEFAQTLSKDEQDLYCINLCLTYAPPSVRLKSAPVLLAACKYTKMLLLDSSHLKWGGFQIHPQLERMGHWIGVLSIEYGPPPPLYYINIPLLLRECAVTGSLGHCLIFLNAMFSHAQKLYYPPNPYTVMILSILSAVYHAKDIRIDIKEQINKFCSIFNTNIKFFYSRTIKIPINSFDSSAQFISTGSQVIFQSSGLIPKNFSPIVNINPVLNGYFHYVPDKGMLPQNLQSLYSDAHRIEKFYFINGISYLNTEKLINLRMNDFNSLQCFVSLALSDSPILSKVATVLFKKATKYLVSPIDISSLFRCAFPNWYIFSACIQRKTFAPEDINSLFSELLTNRYTESLAKPMILAFLPFCFESFPNFSFVSIKEILGISNQQIKYNKPKVLPQPPKEHATILRAFIEFLSSKEPTSTFINVLKSISVQQLISLFSFVFSITKKSKKTYLVSKFDYSAIDSLCQAFGIFINSNPNNNKFINSLFNSIRSIAPESPPLLLFRLIYDIILNLQITNYNINVQELIDLLNDLSPTKIPSFSICWTQLVMNKIALPHFIKSNNPIEMQFCLNSIITMITLLQKLPETFYRGVIRILITIQQEVPYFFVAYHSLLLESLPIRFVQVRNIILGSSPSNINSDNNPPIGFNLDSELKMDSIQTKLDQSLTNKIPISSCLNLIVGKFEKEGQHISKSIENITIPKFIWQFVLYIINKNSFSKSLIFDLFVSLQNEILSKNDRLLSILYSSIIDQLRYPNRHSKFSSELLMHLFGKGNKIHREILIVNLLRRILCVTSPPSSLRNLYSNISSEYKSDIEQLFQENNEVAIFQSSQQLIDNL